jgi:DivIVA domain-containing protein
MTLSLDDVRNKRFRMARKSGYEVLEVDEFVDEVEATFEQLFEENRNLKKQVESLKATGPAAAPSKDASPATGEETRPAAVAAPAASTAEQHTERIVVTTGKEASSAVVRLVQLSTEQAERLVAEATAEAAQIREQASTSADAVGTEARAQAERLQADAQSRAEALDQETATRRTELFGELEKQRDELTATVHALRAFEATYRSNLTRHLQSQIDVLASGKEEPADPPSVVDEPPPARTGAVPATAEGGPDQPATSAGEGAADGAPATAPTSETPRLDALLGDQR